MGSLGRHGFAAVSGNTTLSVMVCGDSGVNALGDGPRTALWRRLKQRGAVRFLGPAWDICGDHQEGPYLALGMGEHAGYPGATISQWLNGDMSHGPGLAGILAAAGTPDVAIVMLGSNDVSAYAADIVALTKTQGQALALMQADMRTLDAAWRAQSPTTRVIYATIPPWASPASNFATAQILRNSFNAWLLTSGLGALICDACGDLGISELGTDGIHLNRRGWTHVGNAYADAVERVAPILPAGTPWPDGYTSPPFTKMPGLRQASVKTSNTGDAQDRASLNAMTRTKMGSGNILVAFNYYPIADPQESNAVLPAGASHTLWSSATVTTDDYLVIAADGPEIQVRTPGSSAFTMGSGNGPVQLIAGSWNQVVLWMDKATLTATGYVNGAPFGRVTVPDWTLSGSDFPYVGFGFLNWSNPGAAGYYDDMILATGSSLPAIGLQFPVIEALYLRAVAPPGTSVRYLADEGTGTALADKYGGANGALRSGGGSTTWVAAGTALKPWDV